MLELRVRAQLGVQIGGSQPLLRLRQAVDDGALVSSALAGDSLYQRHQVGATLEGGLQVRARGQCRLPRRGQAVVSRRRGRAPAPPPRPRRSHAPAAAGGPPVPSRRAESALRLPQSSSANPNWLRSRSPTLARGGPPFAARFAAQPAPARSRPTPRRCAPGYPLCSDSRFCCITTLRSRPLRRRIRLRRRSLRHRAGAPARAAARITLGAASPAAHHGREDQDPAHGHRRRNDPVPGRRGAPRGSRSAGSGTR